MTFEIGGNGQPSITVEVVENTGGQLFVNLKPTSFDGDVADIDGLFFNFSDDATIEGLHFFPDENALPVTGHAAVANGVNTLDDGTTVPQNFDGMVQFGQIPDSTEGTVNNANFTLWSDNGPLSLADLDLSSMSLVVTNPDGSQDILEGGYDPAAAASDSASYTNGGVSDDGLAAWYNTHMGGGSGEEEDGGSQVSDPSEDDILALMNQPVDDGEESCGSGTDGSGFEHCF